jgi:2-dehydro-3-deoxy-D-arabinonate dehydratase
MKICRFRNISGSICIGLLLEDGAESVLNLTDAGIKSLSQLFEVDDFEAYLASLAQRSLPLESLQDVHLLAPVERQEVWAAGVTYLRSKKARMEESNLSAAAYDQVYVAPRPELFFKSLADKVVGPGECVGIRFDAKWNVPEPELVLVINARGRLVGYAVGNDMSSRDIEGQNLLYLPQAKIYDRSCALGPFITIGADEALARTWGISLTITRAGAAVFEGETSVGQIKRAFSELVHYLFRSQSFPHGAFLFTGTGIVPPENFTLQPRDIVRITISGIGTLENAVSVVGS